MNEFGRTGDAKRSATVEKLEWHELCRKVGWSASFTTSSAMAESACPKNNRTIINNAAQLDPCDTMHLLRDSQVMFIILTPQNGALIVLWSHESVQAVAESPAFWDSLILGRLAHNHSPLNNKKQTPGFSFQPNTEKKTALTEWLDQSVPNCSSIRIYSTWRFTGCVVAESRLLFGGIQINVT